MNKRVTGVFVESTSPRTTITAEYPPMTDGDDLGSWHGAVLSGVSRLMTHYAHLGNVTVIQDRGGEKVTVTISRATPEGEALVVFELGAGEFRGQSENPL